MARRVDHSHGDSGTKPDSNLNFQDGDYPDPEEFDWFWYNVPQAINDHAGTIEDFQNGNVSVAQADNAAHLEGTSLSDVRSHDHSTLGNVQSGQHHSKTDSLQEIQDSDPIALVLNNLSGLSAGTQNRVLITTDNNGIYYDDGSSMELIADHPSNIGTGDLGFDPATQNDLDDQVSKTGDSMSGRLDMNDTMDASDGAVVLPVGTDQYDS
jgi:hypothetical protein